MKINVQLSCSDEYIYNKIIDSVMLDIHNNSNKRPQKNYLEGFSYDKICSDGSRAKITITSQVKNKEYSFETKTLNKKYTSKYSFEKVDDKICNVIFEEKIYSNTALQRINDYIVQLVVGHNRKKQFKQMLEQMALDSQFI